MSAVAVLRPEPGASRTAARARARGLDTLVCPLFEVQPVAWTPPDPTRFDALLLTSAAAVRHAGEGLASLSHLPVVAVGPETARAAHAARLAVAVTGRAGASHALAVARAEGLCRFLHLAGRDRMPDAPEVEPVVVYRSEALPMAPGWTRTLADRVVLLHSSRAAARLAELVERDATERASIGVAALGPAILDALGTGWASTRAAAHPTDEALLDVVIRAD